MPNKSLPLSAYNASNSSKTAELFIKRKIYKSYAYYDPNINSEGGKLPPPIKDFWTQEDCLYGRIDRKGRAVQVDRQSMVEIEEGVEVINFVGAAYKQMKKEFEIAALKDKFPRAAPPFTDFKAKVGYTAPLKQYFSIFPLIQSKLIRDSALNPDISSLKDFVPVFVNAMKDLGTSFPISFSSYIVGPISFILQSGLSFEIAIAKHDSDEEKVRSFIMNPAFGYYKNVALKYGFFIDMNAPWRLVANLSSPPMRKFMGAFMGKGAGPSRYFEAMTAPAYLGDISTLQNLALSSYNQLVQARPHVKKRIIKKGSICTTTIHRPPAGKKDLMNDFPDLYWLKFYIELKNNEKGASFTEARLNHIFNNSKNLVKSLDTGQALRYINRNFDDLRSINGSYNYELYKTFFDNMEPSSWPFTDFQEYFKHVVSLGTYKRY